jgi:PD-(D/E)XK endonuclease
VLTTNQKGALAEAKIALACIEAGFGIARPFADERYDLIVDLGPRLLRLQCKWAVQRGDVVVITCRTNRRGPNGFVRRTYRPGEIDAIAAYCQATDVCYLLPLEQSIGRTAVSLRVAPSRNNQHSRVNWAQDFELGATLSTLLGPIAQLGERVHGMHEAAGSSPAGSIIQSPAKAG